MSDKKRCDIKLIEMQDYCDKCEYCAKCELKDFCPNMTDLAPKHWDLSDPPRFNEQQMALMKGLYANGATQLKSDCAITSLFRADHEYIGNLINSQIGIELSDGETLNLAELLGKDGESK